MTEGGEGLGTAQGAAEASAGAKRRSHDHMHLLLMHDAGGISAADQIASLDHVHAEHHSERQFDTALSTRHGYLGGGQSAYERRDSSRHADHDPDLVDRLAQMWCVRADLDDLQGSGAACLDVGRDYHLPLLPLDGEQPQLAASCSCSRHTCPCGHMAASSTAGCKPFLASVSTHRLPWICRGVSNLIDIETQGVLAHQGWC